MKCQVCLEGDSKEKGPVTRYRNDIADINPGYYHAECATKVGFNEWDEDED